MDLNQSNINEQAPEKERGYILRLFFKYIYIYIR